jgi:hypothetical protein
MMRYDPPYRARRLAVALLLAAGISSPAAAQDGEFSPFGDPDERMERLEPPLTSPDVPRGTVWRYEDAPKVPRVDRIRDVFRAIEACWQPPAGSGYSGQEITLRIAFKRNGEVLGLPKITYYRAGTQPEQREPFTRSVREAFVRCTPLPFTEGLGGAVAGRPFLFRFVDSRPM